MCNDDILSFYLESKRDGILIKEYLHEHVNSALSYAEEVESSRAGRLARLYARDVNFAELLRLSIVFHDVGKAFYQNMDHNMRENKETGERYLSFAGHEYISATIANEFIFRLSERCHSFYYDTVTFSILYHHHAMGSREKIVEKLRKRLQKMPLSEYQECLDKLGYLLNRFLTGYRDVIENVLESLRKSQTMIIESAIHHTKIYERIVHANIPSYKKLAFLLLDSLIVCDYLAASKSRGGCSRFQKTVYEFYMQWLKSAASGKSECVTY